LYGSETYRSKDYYQCDVLVQKEKLAKTGILDILERIVYKYDTNRTFQSGRLVLWSPSQTVWWHHGSMWSPSGFEVG